MPLRARAVRDWLGKNQVPGEGLRLEVPETDSEETDPPSEDHTSSDDDLVDKMANYVASGWKRDLTHIIGCCWAAQVGSLESEEWGVAIRKFLSEMTERKAREWTDVKELTPLKFMPYVAKLFKEVTGKDLQGLGQFTGWIGLGGYYHWRVGQQGQIHLVLCLQGQPMPRTPTACPSGRPLPPKLARPGTPATGASAARQGRAQPTQQGGGQGPTSSQGGRSTTSSQGGTPLAPRQSGRPASTSEGATPTTSGGPPDQPPGRRGAGDSNWSDWYQRTMRESRSRISEPQGPPYPIGSTQARRDAVGQIYG